MYHKIYEGEFLSLDAVTWKVSILRDQETAPASVGVLDFPGDSPLVIDWQETSKEEVICGSIATVTLISPGDRTYIDLYTEIPGSVRMEVRRNGSLYWSGTLDPEFYEEPYSAGCNYNVSLSFSDFGILQRLKYNLSGIRTLQNILTDALTRAGLAYTAVDTSMISTALSGSLLTLQSVKVRSDNFYDEDGIAFALQEVVEGILRPLALRMIQKAGTIWIYDINGLMSCEDHVIEWGADDQMLSVDKVFNDIKVTLSLYEAENASADFEYRGDVSVEKVNLTMDTPEDGDYYSFYPDYNLSQTDYRNVDFTIFQGGDASGIAYKHSGMEFFKILPVLGSGECEGIRRWFTVGHHSIEGGGTRRKGLEAGVPSDSTALMETEPLLLGSLQSSSDKRLKLVQKVLVDARYNPFTEAGDYNEKSNYDSLREVLVIEIPVKVEVLDDSGTVIWHYTNRSVRDYQFPSGAVTVERLLGSWAAGPAAYDDCLLKYYNFKEGVKELLGGWLGNRQACMPLQDDAYLGASLFAAEDGQYMPYPPSGGRLRVTVCAGVKMYAPLQGQLIDATENALAITRWFLYEAPFVQVVKANLIYEPEPGEDVEYTGTANANAREDLELDEICGTMEQPSPTARGLLLDASGLPITQLTRAGRTDTAEQLLIGTLYSQFAERKTVLTGTMLSYAGGLRTFTDERLDGVKMMALSEREDCAMDEIYIRAAEIVADEYTAE